MFFKCSGIFRGSLFFMRLRRMFYRLVSVFTSSKRVFDRGAGRNKPVAAKRLSPHVSLHPS